MTRPDGDDAIPDPHRPVYHFAPNEGWMNDPNGLVYHGGCYHLFYQAGEDRRRWDHATSEDLVTWTEHGTKLSVEDGIQQFSGGAAVDEAGNAGVGEGALAFAYTGHHDDGIEDQRLAYSTDGARTVTRCPDNPVIPSEVGDFRDPNLLRYGDEWRLVVSRVTPADDRPAGIEVYRSGDLREWTYEHTAELVGERADALECPDLFELPVEGEDGSGRSVFDGSRRTADDDRRTTRDADDRRSVHDDDDDRRTINDHEYDGPWGLLASADWDRQLLFVGEFDGTAFEPDRCLRVDHGFDFYAGMTWANEPEGRRLLVGWLNHWDYAHELPERGWTGVQSFPRELSLVEGENGSELRQRPASELSAVRGSRLTTLADEPIAPGRDPLADAGVEGGALVIDARFDPGDADEVGLRVRESDDARTIVGYDADRQCLRLDRSEAGAFFGEEYSEATAPLELLPDGTVELRILVDRPSVEVFVNDGRRAASALVFPEPDATGVSTYARGGTAELVEFVADVVDVDSGYLPRDGDGNGEREGGDEQDDR